MKFRKGPWSVAAALGLLLSAAVFSQESPNRASSVEPFLGRWENYRYFEMPLIGLIGFIPFGLECWVMWQTIRILFDGLAEPLGSERELL